MDSDYAQICVPLAQDLTNQALDAVADLEYNRRLVPFVVETMTADIMGALAMAFLHHDEPVNPDEWALIDDEPAPVPVDSWARGAIPVRVRPKPIPMEPSSRPESQSRARTPLGGSLASPSFRRPKTPDPTVRLDSFGNVVASQSRPPSQATSDSPHVSGSKGDAAGERRASKANINSLSTANGSTANGKGAPAKSKAKPAFVPPEEPVQVPENLKGKDYTYDHRGKMVEVATVVPEKLPSSFVNPKVNIRSPSQSTEAAETRGKGRGNASSSSPSKSSTTHASSGAAGGTHAGSKKDKFGSTVVKSEGGKFVQPLEPLPGVVLRDGGATRVGPPKDKDKYHMTRRDYMSSNAVVNQMLTRSVKDRQSGAVPASTATLAADKQSAIASSSTIAGSSANVSSAPTQRSNTAGALSSQQSLSKQSSMVKSRKDRSVNAPLASADDEFALMRKQSSIMRAGIDPTVTPVREPARVTDRAVVNNPKLAREIMQ